VTAYILRRLAQLPLVVIGVLTIAFLVVQLVPGDPAVVIAGESAPPEVVEAIRQDLGLNEPLPVQYGRFLGKAVQLDFGRSLQTKRPVLAEITRTFPATLELVLLTVMIGMPIGILLGVLGAVYRGTWLDKGSMVFALSMTSFPSFFIALGLMFVFAYWLPLLPSSGRQGSIFEPDNLRFFILPALALAGAPMGSLARVTRSSMLEVLSEDFVRTAKAKGLAERLVVWRHALKNAMLPVITLMGLQVGTYLGGSVVVETVFGWPGVGRLAITAILNQDFPVIQGAILVLAMSYVIVNLLVDLSYAFFDPRIRVS
jgi:ABC-type dipeptide/oligopeptide/nickel transport system permease component